MCGRAGAGDTGVHSISHSNRSLFRSLWMLNGFREMRSGPMAWVSLCSGRICRSQPQHHYLSLFFFLISNTSQLMPNGPDTGVLMQGWGESVWLWNRCLWLFWLFNIQFASTINRFAFRVICINRRRRVDAVHSVRLVAKVRVDHMEDGAITYLNCFSILCLAYFCVFWEIVE